ncbi:MAG: pirin-like C-terminal cupin domain-containing protein [Pseudomonadota bacterium]|nr:pirin-like C-terminal cupin domain-containing protein [Pseudomonadota bacterium]
MQKTVIGVSRPPAAQAVGQAYQEHVYFSCQGLGRQANPLIHLAWAPPASHPAQQPAPATGVQAQAGSECVTLLLQGQLHAQDSAGHSHTLDAGDVLWLSAGQGLLHQQRHGDELARRGGTLELLTLWINLPAACKLSPPHAQHLTGASIPAMALPDDAGSLRLIAGEWGGQLGPAETVTPLQLWDITLHPGRSAHFTLPRGWHGVLLVLHGAAQLNRWPHPIPTGHLALLDAAGDEVQLSAGHTHPARVLLASGEPLQEPIASQGALVMNHAEQLPPLAQALARGDFGTLG